MDYEKAYKDALERCKKEFNFSNLAYSHEEIKQRLERVFPELKESEDERIRKWCISHFRECFRATKDNVEYQEYRNNKVIPWLEKQREQKIALSEYDLAMIDNLITDENCPLDSEYMSWLKSLKDKVQPNRWKPSEEQLKKLWDAIVYVEGCDSNFRGANVLESLYNDSELPPPEGGGFLVQRCRLLQDES